MKIAVVKINSKNYDEDFYSASFAQTLRNDLEWVELTEKEYHYLLPNLGKDMIAIIDHDNDENEIVSVEDALQRAKAWEIQMAQLQAKADAKATRRKNKRVTKSGLTVKQENELKRLRAEFGEDHG